MTLQQALALSVTVVSAGAVVTAALVPRWSEVRQRRLDRYAEAAKAIVAWVEFPYRVARRVSDNTSLLADLAAHGHDLQERLAFHAAWISGESRRTGRLYEEVLDAIKTATAPALHAAWTSPPADKPGGMNVGSLGFDARASRRLLNRVHVAVRHRFGRRRLLGWAWRWALPTFRADVDPPTLKADSPKGMTSDSEGQRTLA